MCDVTLKDALPYLNVPQKLIIVIRSFIPSCNRAVYL